MLIFELLFPERPLPAKRKEIDSGVAAATMLTVAIFQLGIRATYWGCIGYLGLAVARDTLFIEA